MKSKSKSRDPQESGFFSIDAMFAVTLLLMITITFTNVYEARQTAAEHMAAGLEAKLACEELAAAINSTYASGESFRLKLKLSENAAGYAYLIRFDNSAATLIALGNWGAVTAKVACNNVRNFELGPDDLRKIIEVRWVDNQLEVVSP
jgi:hypothetical protein